MDQILLRTYSTSILIFADNVRQLCTNPPSIRTYLVLFRSTVCVCVLVILFILDVRFVDVPAGVTQEEGHTGFLHHPSAVLAFIFLARKIQPFLSLVDREVEFYVLTI